MKLIRLIIFSALLFGSLTGLANTQQYKDITNLIGSETSTNDQTIMILKTPIKSKVTFDHGKFSAENSGDKFKGTYKATEAKSGQIYLNGIAKAPDNSNRYFNSVYTPVKSTEKNGKLLYSYKTIITDEEHNMTIISGIVHVTMHKNN